MGTEREDVSRFTQSIVSRVILFAGLALLGSAVLVHSEQWLQRTDAEDDGRTITITIQYDPSHHAVQTDHRMDRESMTHYDEGVWIDKEYTAPRDMWLTEFSTDFTGESVHNFYLFIKDTKDSWCPENPEAIYSGGTVTARRPVAFDSPYGVLVKKGTTLTLSALYHEAAGATSGVKPSFSVHARYEPVKDSTRSIPLTLHYITPGPCRYTRPVFPVPAHAKDALYSSADTPFVFPADGSIVRALAHFHAAYTEGVANTVRLFLNNKEIDSFTTTNVRDDAERNPRLLTDTLVSVRKGDILTMHAIFSTPSETPVAEGMAIIGFYFAAQAH